MTEKNKEIKPDVYKPVGNGGFSFEHNGKEVVLPRTEHGFVPNYSYKLYSYEEENKKGEKITYYSFDGEKGENEALYGIDPKGNISVKIKGKDETNVSYKDMNEIKKGGVGLSFKDTNLNTGEAVSEFVSINNKVVFGAAAAGLLMGGVPGAVICGCGAWCLKEYLKYKEKSKSNALLNMFHKSKAKSQ